jgi:hypothetical protein
MEKQTLEQPCILLCNGVHCTHIDFTLCILQAIQVRDLRGWWTGNGRPKALTAPTLEASASTGSGGLGNTVNINIKTSNESLVGDPEAIPLRGSVQSLKEETPTRRTLRPR